MGQAARSAPRLRGRRSAARATLGAAACLLAAALALAEGIPAPVPETSTMEHQVVEAIQAAREAVARAPEDPTAWGEYGRILHAHGLSAEALTCYRQAMDLAPDDHRWPHLGARILELEDAEGALTLARQAIARKAQFAPAHVLAGRLEEKLGRAAAAEGDYRRALSVDPDSPDAEFGLGRLALQAGDAAAAVPHLERARDLQPRSGSVHAILARAYHRQGDAGAAERSAFIARNLRPDYPMADPLMDWVDDAAVSTPGYEARAARAEASGDTELAESLLRRLVALHPEDGRRHFALGVMLYRAGDADRSEEAVRRALELDPDLAPAHLILGSLLLLRNQITEGLRHFEAPVTLSRDDVPFLVDLARTLMEKNHGELAAYFLGKATGLDPTRADAPQVLGQLTARMGHYDEAIAYLQTAINLQPVAAGPHLDLAMTYARAGRYRDAWEHVHEAQRLGAKPPPEFLAWLARNEPEPARSAPPP